MTFAVSSSSNSSSKHRRRLLLHDMRFRIFHRTRYVYRASVRDNYNEVRLRPATDDKSRLESFLLCIKPPARLQHFRDNWLNYVHYFDISEPHSDLTIESQSTINTTNPYKDGKPLGIGFEALKSEVDEMISPFLGDSCYVSVTPEVWRLGIDIRNDSNDVFATAEAVMHHIYREWTYAPSSTTTSTHMNEVMQTKRGVCQDFAHVMIGICRSLGIPARYVSGYLYNGPDSHLRGAQASHAWCEVYIPGK
ncbi:MAG: hypothetical protein B7Z37_26995, partial [Verrucomicrobia bacterium 12-59-8]